MSINKQAESDDSIPVAGSGFAFCCGKKTHVLDSRRSGRGLRRRRVCAACGQRYTTMEVIAPQEDEHNLLGSDITMFTALETPARHAVRALLVALTKKGTTLETNHIS